MENTHTSLELSKKLYEAGFKWETEVYHFDFKWQTLNWENRTEKRLDRFIEGSDDYMSVQDRISNETPAYDILNDLCVQYWKELFWRELQTIQIQSDVIALHWVTSLYKMPQKTLEKWEIVIEQIFKLLQQGRKQEVEDYIWKNCLLNKSK